MRPEAGDELSLLLKAQMFLAHPPEVPYDLRLYRRADYEHN